MTMTARDSLINAVSDNLRTILAVGGGYVLAVETDVIEAGYPSIPSLPEWWTLAALAVAGTIAVAWTVGDKIADLLPRDRTELRAVFAKQRYALDGDELDEILNVVAKYA